MTTSDPEAATARVAEQLTGVGRLGVAFSGGVDSSVLLALAAVRSAPDRVVAVLGVSPSLAADERSAAHDVARHIGVPVVEVDTHEGDRAEYRANGPDRCFHCKDELFTRIGDEVVTAHRLDAVAYGENADDARRPDRPGAPRRHRAPRAAPAGRRRVWTRPRYAASPARSSCPARTSRRRRAWPRASRTSPRSARRSWRQIERAEAALRRLGFADLRVRHHGEIARVELPAGRPGPGGHRSAARAGHAAGAGAGFRFVAVDLAGIQSGAFTRPLRARPPGDMTCPGTPTWTWSGRARRGYPEAVYCAGKTPEQVAGIAAAVRDRADLVTLFTRAESGARRGGPRRAAGRPPRPGAAAAGLAADAARTRPADRSSCWPRAPRTCRWPARPCSPPGIWAGTPSWSSTSAWPGCTGCCPSSTCSAGRGP